MGHPHIFMVKAAKQAGRYEDMVERMKAFVEGEREEPGLDLELRTLLYGAYKNVADARRASLRAINLIVDQETAAGSNKVDLTVDP